MENGSMGFWYRNVPSQCRNSQKMHFSSLTRGSEVWVIFSRLIVEFLELRKKKLPRMPTMKQSIGFQRLRSWPSNLEKLFQRRQILCGRICLHFIRCPTIHIPLFIPREHTKSNSLYQHTPLFSWERTYIRIRISPCLEEFSEDAKCFVVTTKNLKVKEHQELSKSERLLGVEAVRISTLSKREQCDWIERIF